MTQHIDIAWDRQRNQSGYRQSYATCEGNDRHRLERGACWSYVTIFGGCNTQAPGVISRNDVGIGVLVFGRHYLDREATLECGADHRAVNSVEMSHRVNSLLDIFNDESSFSITHHFRYRTLIEGNDWRTAGHGLYHHKTEGLGPRDGEEYGMGATQEVRLLGFAYLTDELHSRCVKKGKNTCFEIISIRWVHLRGDAKWQARAASYFNGAVHTFLGCDAA